VKHGPIASDGHDELSSTHQSRVLDSRYWHTELEGEGVLHEYVATLCRQVRSDVPQRVCNARILASANQGDVLKSWRVNGHKFDLD
jgi:hypothetical protein